MQYTVNIFLKKKHFKIGCFRRIFYLLSLFGQNNKKIGSLTNKILVKIKASEKPIYFYSVAMGISVTYLRYIAGKSKLLRTDVN